MRSYNASFVYSRLWLLARERNVFSGELADVCATNISCLPPSWAPQEYIGCTAKQQQPTRPHPKLGWCHQWCSSSWGCTGSSCQWDGSQAAALPINHSTCPSRRPASLQEWHMGRSRLEGRMCLAVWVINFQEFFNQFRMFQTGWQEWLKPYLTKTQELNSQLWKTPDTRLCERENDPNYLKIFRRALMLD